MMTWLAKLMPQRKAQADEAVRKMEAALVETRKAQTELKKAVKNADFLHDFLTIPPKKRTTE